MVKAPLTTAQYALVEQHLYLINTTLKLMGWSTQTYNHDVMYDIGLDRLFKAARTFDPNRGNFDNIAFTAIKTGLIEWWKSKKQQKNRKSWHFSHHRPQDDPTTATINFEFCFRAANAYDGKHEKDIQKVNKLLSYLSEPQRLTLIGIYGLNGNKKINKDTIAMNLRVSPSMVEYYRHSGLRELRQLVKKLNREEILN